MAFGSSSALLRYVVKAVGLALTSSMARTNRSQRSRELSGRMTGGGLMSGQDSLVTSSSLGRYSSSLTRWRSRRHKNNNFNFNFISTVVTNILLAKGHFRVTFYLCVRANLRAKPFIVSPARTFSCKSNSFSFEWFRTDSF